MTDLSAILPDFPQQAYASLLPSLERHHVTTTDLITQDAIEIAKKTKLPILNLRKLCAAVLGALQEDVSFTNGSSQAASGSEQKSLMQLRTISTLDNGLDQALAGGVPTRRLTEIVGESGVGKSQCLFSLLLACQLPAPYGLGRAVLYISTESALPTTRLAQMLKNHPVLLAASPRPSLDRIISIVTPDLESQDHILRFQVPVAIKLYHAGLIVLDSVAANYRAEFERAGTAKNGAHMAKRSDELIKLGALLRSYAETYDLAVVVANQVADRFAYTHAHFSRYKSSQTPAPRDRVPIAASQSSPLAHRAAVQLPPSSAEPYPSQPMVALLAKEHETSPLDSILTLDHQQRWFTGWGDDFDKFSDSDPSFHMLPQKTPALGLVWTNQIDCRIALIKTPVFGHIPPSTAKADAEYGEPVLKKWRRHFKVVFASWEKPSATGVTDSVEFEVCAQGLRSIRNKSIDEHSGINAEIREA